MNGRQAESAVRRIVHQEEGGGSSAYVPEDKSKDLQLKAAIDILHGVKVASNAKPKEGKPTTGTGADGSEINAN